jgi:phosphatidylinositol glycan class B
VNVSVRAHLAALLVVTCITAWFSYAYFHNDEYFQIIELTRSKLDPAAVPVLPWEHAQGLRPWLQPFLYWTIARAVSPLGVHDLFRLAFVYRLMTGLANVGAALLFMRTTMPWQRTDEERRLHLRVVTLAGFLPYLFVRTSSESGSMAVLTAAWAILLRGATPSEDGRTWSVPSLAHPLRLVGVGLGLGFAFEIRFQTAFLAIGTLAWLALCASSSSAKERSRAAGMLALGGLAAIGVGLLVDRWGYGEWTFPAWRYFQANVLEGAASSFGTDPPFAYLWMLPANVFLPALVALLVLAFMAWVRCPRHPVTWTTLPFFLVHNLLSHKEERFLFPMAIFATAFVTMALAPRDGPEVRSFVPVRIRASVERLARWGWKRRGAWPAKLVSVTSFAAMALLAFVPLGWHHDVRFTRYLHERFGDEVHATILPEIELNLPAFHPRVYDVDKADLEELGRRIDAGTARPWLIAAQPILHLPLLEKHAHLVFCELPGYSDPELLARLMRIVDAYNAHAPPPLRQLHFRALYRIDR